MNKLLWVSVDEILEIKGLIDDEIERDFKKRPGDDDWRRRHLRELKSLFDKDALEEVRWAARCFAQTNFKYVVMTVKMLRQEKGYGLAEAKYLVDGLIKIYEAMKEGLFIALIKGFES
jgi:hypothetical protein